MNNEKHNQIIDEVYDKWITEYWNNRIYPNQNVKKQFINKCKTDNEFSKKWGLKIEERELSLEERFELFKKQNNGSHPEDIEIMDDYDIPTKVITITYQNETIESYE
jgi:hypothetical protein